MSNQKKIIELSLPENILRDVISLREDTFHGKTDSEVLEELIRLGLQSVSTRGEA